MTTFRFGTNEAQNRELQIMRIVRHPNIVELKAFYYSNGDRVPFREGSPSMCLDC